MKFKKSLSQVLNENLNESDESNKVLRYLHSKGYISDSENPDTFDYQVSAEAIEVADRGTFKNLEKDIISKFGNNHGMNIVLAENVNEAKYPKSMADFFEETIDSCKGFADFKKKAKAAGFTEKQAKSVLSDYEQGGDDYVKNHNSDIMVESVNESVDITSDSEFKEYAETVLKQAHGDDYDQSIADKTVKDILADSDGDFGSAIGKLTSGLG